MTAVVERAARRYDIGGPETRSVLGRREPGEALLLIGAVAVGVVCCLLAGSNAVGLLVLALAVGGAVVAVFVPVRGRTLYRWVPVEVRYLGRRLRGQTAYRSPAREMGFRLDATPVDVAPPPTLGRLRWLSTDQMGEELAVLQQQDEGCLTAVLEVEGPGLALFDGPDLERAGARWGGVLRDLANADGLVRRLQLVERCIPSDPEAHRRYVAEFDGVPALQQLTDSYGELQHIVGSVSEQHRNYVVVRVESDRRLARAVRAAGGGVDGLVSVVAREVDGVRSRLEDAGTRVLRPLGCQELAAFLRSSYEPDRPVDPVEPYTPRDAWPREVVSQPSSLQVDGWRHATAWVRSWPQVPVGVAFLAPLLVQSPGVIRSVSVLFELAPTEIALMRAMSDLTNDEAESSAAEKAGRTADPRRSRQRSQAEQRAADLASGAAGVRMVGYLTVSAAGDEAIAEAKRRTRSAAARSWLVLEWCDKEHDDAFATTLPLARGMA